MRRHDSPFPSTIFSSLYGRGINKFYSVCQLFYITPPFAEDAGRGTNVFYPVCRPFCIMRPFTEETIRGTREVLYITPSFGQVLYVRFILPQFCILPPSRAMHKAVQCIKYPYSES